MSTLIRPTILDPRAYSRSSLLGPDGRPMRNILNGGLADHFYLPPSGSDQGFHAASDVVEETVDGVSTNELWAVYQQLVEAHNQERQALIDFLSYFVPNPTEAVSTGVGDAKMERATQYGIPRSVRASVDQYFLGFDFNWYDLANRFTWEFLADATAAQVDSAANAALEADNVLMFQLVMWTLFNNVNRTAKIKKQPYNVYTFWNGADSEVPEKYKTNTFDSTHTHYLVSGAATISPGDAGTGTPGDLDDLIEHLRHHGFSRVNGYEIVIMMNKVEADAVRNWRSVANGGTALYDFVPAQGTPSFLLPADLVTPEGTTRPAANLRGMTVFGSYDEATLVQEDYIPPKYLTAFATGGRLNVRNPVGLREHRNPRLRGFRIVRGRRDDYPLQEAYFQRGVGSGIRHRGAGAVMQIKASGSYTIPTEYATQP